MADFGAIGGGAADGLHQVLARLFIEAKQRDLVAQQQAELAENRRQADMQNALGNRRVAVDEGQLGISRDRVGLDRDKFGQDVREYDEGAPQRTATLRHIGAQTTELERKPIAEQEARDFTAKRDQTLHGYDLKEIGAQGAQAQATARIRARPRISKTAGINAQGQAVTKFIDIDSGETVHEELAAPTTDDRNRQAAGGRATPFIQRAGELSQVINTKFGPEAKVLGTLRGLQAKANLDHDVAEYLSLVEGFTPLMARAAGHTGVLTERDVERTIQLLPKPGDSAELARRKLANLDRLMGGGGATPAAGGGGQGVKITSIQEIK